MGVAYLQILVQVNALRHRSGRVYPEVRQTSGQGPFNLPPPQRQWGEEKVMLKNEPMKSGEDAQREIQARLEAEGDVRAQLILEGYSAKSIDKVRRRMKLLRPQRAVSETGMTSAKLRTGGSGIQAKVQNESIVLPRDMFTVYDWIIMMYPDYQPSKAEWLQHVVATFAMEHAQELGLANMPSAFAVGALGVNVSEQEQEEADDTAEVEERLDPVGSAVSHRHANRR
jgi:hypothetical protein